MLRTSRHLRIPHRWGSRAYLWTQGAYWSVRDWFTHQSDSKPRKRSVLLDVEPLERRQMPAFVLSLYSDAVADPVQGATAAISRTNVGVLDGNASIVLPFNAYQSDTSGSYRDDTITPTALVYNSATTNVKPVLQFQITSAGGDPVPTSID